MNRRARTIVVGTNMLIGGLLKVTYEWRSAEPYPADRSQWLRYVRSDLKLTRTSSEKSFGCSQAAKWPPFSSLL